MPDFGLLRKSIPHELFTMQRAFNRMEADMRDDTRRTISREYRLACLSRAMEIALHDNDFAWHAYLKQRRYELLLRG